ncbi:MepB family protein [Pedobacter sp. PAMC26386]|nr:MepB family protein [Pedobacter sp. PAMC26386]
MSPESTWTTRDKIPETLFHAQNLIYKPCGFNYTGPIAEAESSDYAAYKFEVNHLAVKYREGKITPTKIGQFVTLWKRLGKGPIQPFDHTDAIDLFIVSTRDGERFGQFIFPKQILLERGILSTDQKEGKRAIRVYPPWNITTSIQAQKTQQWQLTWFLEIPVNHPIDLARAKALYQS